MPAGDYKSTELGVLFSDYWAEVEARDGKCDLCGHKAGKRGLFIDHDHAHYEKHPYGHEFHSHGPIRGLLCQGCNNLLGRIKDNIEFFERGIEYLKPHRPHWPKRFGKLDKLTLYQKFQELARASSI